VKQSKNRNKLRFLLFNKDRRCIFAEKSQYIGIMTQEEIGKTIRDRRKNLKVDQRTLADLAGVAINTVVAIERGEGNPQLKTLLVVLDTLGLQLDINSKRLAYETMQSICT
jgi:y4mF family transcriptional regulator